MSTTPSVTPATSAARNEVRGVAPFDGAKS
jgi:hypothetical protein